MYNEIIKELRTDNDLKQEFIAKKLGITKQQYSLYETGQRKFKIEHIIALSVLFNVSADYILGLPIYPTRKDKKGSRNLRFLLLFYKTAAPLPKKFFKLFRGALVEGE